MTKLIKASELQVGSVYGTDPNRIVWRVEEITKTTAKTITVYARDLSGTYTGGSHRYNRHGLTTQLFVYV